jgi:DNA-binding transcriptional MerR regulator
MRMKDLVEATGLSRTTIHHYLREGLLPPARKTAANAAVYGREHAERLDLIRGLRTEELGPFPLEAVRSILQLVDDGMDPELAVSLTALPGRRMGSSAAGASERLSAADVAGAAGASVTTVRRLIDAGLLIGRPETGSRSEVFDAADVELVRLYAELLEATDLTVEDVSPVAELIAEIVRYEAVLARVAVSEKPEREHARILRLVSRSMRAVHTYLLVRSALYGTAAAS